MSTVLGCPWGTHERQPCELWDYTGPPSVFVKIVVAKPISFYLYNWLNSYNCFVV
jgi:hypothetical protein